MWDRILLKERGKYAFRRNYWHCVLVAFILLLLVGGSGNSARSEWNKINTKNGNVSQTIIYPSYQITNNSVVTSFERTVSGIMSGSLSSVASLIFSVFTLTVALVILLLGIFVFAPLEVGGCRFFIENSYEPVTAGRILFSFKSGYYGKITAAMFLKSLYTFLWTLLFIIPGIVKSYEYRMVPYLMAEYPEMGASEAFRISRELMYGQKMDTFILDLSFIGWEILSACTCGLVGIFYAAPYQHATNAELFLELKRQYFAKRNQGNGGMYY